MKESSCTRTVFAFLEQIPPILVSSGSNLVTERFAKSKLIIKASNDYKEKLGLHLLKLKMKI